MARKMWSVTQEFEKAHLTQVFSGGACNIRDTEGNLLRNAERDLINDWLTSKKIVFYDPQIHPETHGEEYDYPKHSKIEIAARQAARINLYEISPRTFGGITSIEIAVDWFRDHEPMVLYYSDGNAEDRIPDHTEDGYPLFAPYGVHETSAADRAHYAEMIKNANHMRKHLLHYTRELRTLTVAMRGKRRARDVVITSDQMHAADIFAAVVKAASGRRVRVYFPPDETIYDEKGNPLINLPDDPSEAEMSAMLDQYVDEGNELRQRIAEMLNINVLVRVVYTQRAAILSLEELLSLKQITG